jgi:phenylalanyl-tRNA synthetase beta chain
MNVSYNWLNERLDLSGHSIAELSDLLTFSGIEVEAVNSSGIPTDQIVVAQVKEARPHPNADKLKVCTVDVGDGTDRQIVCGAKNYQAGDKVPCALPGARLAPDFTIRVGKLRGVESQGMLCAGSEIGLTDIEDGLLILPEDSEIGKPMVALYPSDTVFELEITPNRPDCLCHTGVARELATLLKQDLCPVETGPLPEPAIASDDEIALQSSICPFYSALRISGITVKPSPEWLCTKLESIGLRPINNVVDITNYVLHELGQPLHAFDAAMVNGGIVVRDASEGEEFAALDEAVYTLEAEDCVISDTTGTALALGGVMGGLESGVTETTTDLLLESAWFEPSRIRRTSRRLALSSDSSYRFERRVDPEGVLPASALAAKLILELAGGRLDGTVKQAGTLPNAPDPIALSETQLAQVTMGAIAPTEAADSLTRLGLTANGDGTWTIPSFRPDLTRSIDLIEEVVRIAGFDRIPGRILSFAAYESREDAHYDGEMEIKRQLAALGFHEAQSIKLISGDQLKDALPLRPLQDGDVIRVNLPLSEDHAVMRPSTTPGLIASAARNVRQGATSLRFFETGRCFRNAGGGKATDLEAEHLGLLLSGDRQPASWDRSGSANADIADLKAVLAALLPRTAVQFAPGKSDQFPLYAAIQADRKPIGNFAQLPPSRCRELDIHAPVYLAELDLAKLIALRNEPVHLEDLPQFPGSSRDAAMEAPSGMPNGDIEKAIKKLNEPLLVSATCFDLFSDPTGEKLPADRKSIAYSFLYRAADRTLKSEEVDAAHAKLLKHLAKSLPVSFR